MTGSEVAAANPATVTIVTGPPGADIGPAVADTAQRIGLGDGMAIRIVISGHDPIDRSGTTLHTTRHPDLNSRLPIPLWALPSAWHNPDTNLGVIYTGRCTRDVLFDVDTLDSVGPDVTHRLTVQHHGVPDTTGAYIRHPIETGNVGKAARDSVLRAAGNRNVLIEAGNGMSFAEALKTVWPDVTDHQYIDVIDRIWVGDPEACPTGASQYRRT